MPELNDEQWRDVVATVNRSRQMKKWTQLAQEMQSYEGMRLFKQEARVITDGRGPEWKIMLRTNNAARKTDYATRDSLAMIDKWTTAQADWVGRDTSWFVDINALARCKGESAMVEMFDKEEFAAQLDLAKQLEIDLFGIPDAADKKAFLGILYHIVKGATDGFTGGNPTGFSSWCGLDRSLDENANLRNYSIRYKNVTRESLVEALALAFYQTNWVSPVSTDARKFSQERMRVLTKYKVTAKLKRLAQDQNDNLGTELNMYDGEVTVARHPIIAMRHWDNNADITDDPLVGVDYSNLRPCTLSGANFRRSSPHILAGIDHNKIATWIDLSMACECLDPRRLFIAYQDDAAVDPLTLI